MLLLKIVIKCVVFIEVLFVSIVSLDIIWMLFLYVVINEFCWCVCKLLKMIFLEILYWYLEVDWFVLKVCINYIGCIL